MGGGGRTRAGACGGGGAEQVAAVAVSVLRAQHRQAGAARRVPAARSKRSRRSADGLAARGLQQAGEQRVPRATGMGGG
eukprot:3570-Hanusia_phi.AAC.1